jgi:predicted flap endonuclease-1-like 5' DNA nuclease
MFSKIPRGISIWLAGFGTILAFLNAVNSVLLWGIHGTDYIVTPYLLDQLGPISITQYFWVSILCTYIFLGITAIMGLGGQSSFEKKTFDTVEDQKHVNNTFFKLFENHLGNINKEVMNFERMNREQLTMLKSNMAELQSQLTEATLQQQTLSKSITGSTRTWKQTAKKMATDIAELKKGLRTIESTLILPQPKLTLESGTNDIKGIGPRTAEELKSIGITNASQFITTDPAVIGEKTRLQTPYVEQLQEMVQLMMIPEIDDIDVELLQKAGVTTRKELATQDPFELNLKISEIVTAFIKDDKLTESEKPTLEKVTSWVRYARSISSVTESKKRFSGYRKAYKMWETPIRTMTH